MNSRILPLFLSFCILFTGYAVFSRKQISPSAAKTVSVFPSSEFTETKCEKPCVALTFDDGPSARYTPLLLDGLKERGAHATFFLIGKNMEGNEDLVRRIIKEGHIIGNHTYNHVTLRNLPASKAREEILKTNNRIYEITGIYPTLVRPPFGEWQKNLELSVSMLPVMWDIDTLDWKTKNVQTSVSIVEKQLRDGAIILMHDGYASSVEAALEIVDMVLEKGYRLVTVDHLLVC